MRRVAMSVILAAAVLLPLQPGPAPAAAAGADTVSIQIGGAVSYTNAGSVTSGDLVVSPMLGSTVTSVTGSATIPGASGGSATVSFNVRRFWITSVFTGYVRVSDPGAGLALSTPVFFAPVSRVSPRGATSVNRWFKLGSLPWGSYTLNWTVQDSDVPGGGGDPVLVGAGDIASCLSTGDEATAALLDGIAGTVFTLGDNVYLAGSLSEYQSCYEPSWGRHKSRTRPVPGNHEYGTPGAAGYFTYFGATAGNPGQGWYSYDEGTWHVVVLNSNCAAVGGCGAGSAQEQWLRADLAAHPNACTVAMFHHPRFSSSSVHGSNADMAAFWQALQDHGADLVLSGHDHTYERFAPQSPAGVADPAGIRQFVVGTGGFSHYGFGAPLPNSEVRSGSTWGVLKLTLHAGSYDWEFVPVAGASFTDSGSGTCH